MPSADVGHPDSGRNNSSSVAPAVDVRQVQASLFKIRLGTRVPSPILKRDACCRTLGQCYRIFLATMLGFSTSAEGIPFSGFTFLETGEGDREDEDVCNIRSNFR